MDTATKNLELTPLDVADFKDFRYDNGMPPKSYRILAITEIFPDVFQLQLKPADETTIFPFLAGQFIQMKYPHAPTPNAPHMFSIASSPNQREVIECLFRVYGPWTKSLSQAKIGDEVIVAGPFGKFVWDDTIIHAVFLAGGIGIVPMLSMLKYIVETNQQPKITLVYGNRTEDTIAYRKEIDDLLTHLPGSKVVHVLSHVAPNDPSWQGDKGFITEAILRREGAQTNGATFFLCGPPIFISLMKEILHKFSIDPQNIHEELYSSPPPPKPLQ